MQVRLSTYAQKGEVRFYRKYSIDNVSVPGGSLFYFRNRSSLIRHPQFSSEESSSYILVVLGGLLIRHPLFT
jgi:chromosome condensin MukBEF MukE localization factor